MSTGTLIFLLLTVGAVFWMFSMHRGGGHAHGMSGGCGGHGHGNDQKDKPTHDASHEHGQKPLLGPPGKQSTTPAQAPAASHRHRGC